MSSKPVGIRDVAAAAGVSVTTVSQVLNNVATARVGAETRDRVHEAAHRLGYGPNPAARALRTRRSGVIGVIGVICEDLATAPEAARVLLGLEEAATGRGYGVMVSNLAGGGSQEALESGVAALLARHVDGILYAAAGHRRVRLPASLDNVPAVLVDAEDASRSLAAVRPDRAGGVRLAVTALIDAGHTRIGMLNALDDSRGGPDGLRAFRETLADAGLDFHADLVRSGQATAAGGYEAALPLLKLDNQPTAVFCCNDAMAMGLYRAAAETGIGIPGRLSVVGFGNQEMIAANLHPALTSVGLPHHSLGAWAAEHLIDAIEGRSRPGPVASRQAALACTLIVRDSVAPCQPQ